MKHLLNKLVCWVFGHKEDSDFDISHEDLKKVKEAMHNNLHSGVAIYLLCQSMPSYKPYYFCERCGRLL